MSSADSTAAASPPAAPPPLAPAAVSNPFQIRDFRSLFMMRVISTGANQALGVAVGWQVYELTGSALNLGLIGLVQFVAFAAASLAGGQAADLYDRRWIIRCSLLAQTVVAGALVPITLFAEHPVLWIYLLLPLSSFTRAFEPPATDSLVVVAVPRNILAKALASYKASQRVASIATPVLAGFLYLLGAEAVYGLVAILLLGSILASLRLAKPVNPPDKKPVTWETMLAGVQYIRRNEVLLAAVTLDLVAVLFGGATALFPIFAKDILDLGPWGLGLLRSAPALGSILVGFFIARYPVRRSAGHMMLTGILIFGVSYILFALSTNVVLSCLALMISGGGDMVSMVVRHTLLQTHVPDDVRGRVTAANSLFTTSSGSLGDFQSGLAASFLGPVGAILFGASMTLAVVAVWSWKFPVLRRIDRLDAPLPGAVRS